MFLSLFFPCLLLPLFLWVPEKILSLYDCGLSQDGALALERKGLFPLSHDCLSIHLFVHLSIHSFQNIYTAPISARYCTGFKHIRMNEIRPLSPLPSVFYQEKVQWVGISSSLNSPALPQLRQTWHKSRLWSFPRAWFTEGRAVEGTHSISIPVWWVEVTRHVWWSKWYRCVPGSFFTYLLYSPGFLRALASFLKWRCGPELAWERQYIKQEAKTISAVGGSESSSSSPGSGWGGLRGSPGETSHQH